MDTRKLGHYVSAYTRIHVNIHLRQDKKHTVCLFVVLKATEGRKAHKVITAYPRIQLFQGYSFEVAGYSAVYLDRNNFNTTFGRSLDIP